MLPFHPYADLFPLLEGEHFAALVADLQANDIREKIVVWDGAILDGRNRYRAALAAGLIEDDDGPDRSKYFSRFVPAVDGDALTFVISKNLTRRHLDESQRAMIAARLATMRQGERTDLPSANSPKVAQEAAAKTLSISERTLRYARRVQDHGEPELARAVDRGRLAVSVAERASRLSPEVQRRIAAEAEAGNENAARNAVKKEARAEREAALSEHITALPDKRYGVILADPEWRFEPYSRESGMDRAPENHYPTSALADICARRVADIAAPDCVLFLWATVPMLAEAFCVLDAWGFSRFERDPATGFLTLDKREGRYVSSGSWTKYKPGTGIGLGHWFRVDHEILLVATRGSIPAPAKGEQARSVFDEPASRVHSQKPELVYQIIESYFPNLPKIELNARAARAGWDAWGLEAPEPVILGVDLASGPDQCGQITIDPATGEILDVRKTEAEPALIDDALPENSALVNLDEEPENLDIPAFLRRAPKAEAAHG